MGLLARLFGSERDASDLTALWHRLVHIAREPEWYAEAGIDDTVEGRFDALTLVTALVLLRMDGDPALRGPSARLTERFVADMDGQLRQTGVGDLVVGKRMSKLMGALSGRIEAYREGLAASEPALLEAAVARNVTLRSGAAPQAVAARLRSLSRQLAALDNASLLAGDIVR